MKKKILWVLPAILMASLVCTTFTACGSDSEEDSVVDTPFFNVSSTTLIAKGEVPYNGSFTINTNQQWAVTEKPSWLTLSATEGNGRQDIQVSITTSEKNYREGKIVIASADKQFEKTITVRQNGNTLSAVTGDYVGSKVTKGAFMGTDRKQYAYEHKITVEYSINGSHLASDYGVTGATVQGALSDGKHTATVTLYSDRPQTTFTYRAFATSKSTGNKVYGVENTIVSSND